MRRWTIAAAVAAGLVAVATGLGAASAPPQKGSGLGSFFLGARMARAEVIMVYGGSVHDWRLDQGRVLVVRPNALKLSENDGTKTLIPISPAASVTINRRPAVLDGIVRGMTALTARDGDAPATIVTVSGAARGNRPLRGR